MNTAKNDVTSVGLRRQARERERIAGQLGVLIDVSTLIMMAENYGALPERGLRRDDAFLTVVIGQRLESFESESSCLSHGHSFLGLRGVTLPQ